jgi:putative phosphate-binding protein
MREVMIKRIYTYIFVGVAASMLLLSCGKKKSKDGRTDTYSSGSVSFVADESFSPIIEEERDVFEATYPKAKVTPIYSNEVDGMNMLLRGETHLLIAARDFTEKEKQNLKERNFAPKSMPIAYDGLALIVNKANQDTCISIRDVKRILIGSAKKWSDIYPSSTRGNITLVFDNNKSSSVRFVEDSLLNGKPITAAAVSAVKKTAEVVDFVEKNPGAIGIIGSNWLNDRRDSTNLTFNKNIRVMSVSKLANATPENSWKPFQYYLYNGNYPLVRTIYALINDPINGLPWGFAQFIASPKGQLIILKSGLLPVQGNITIRNVNVSN